MQNRNLSKSSNDDHGYMAAFRNLEHKFENMFNHFWHPTDHSDDSAFSSALMFESSPRMDVIDRDKEIFVKAELPGIAKKDLDVTISNNYLFIKAKTSDDKEVEDGNYLRRETRSSEYYRSITLPTNVDADSISSEFKDGVLELTIPKKEEAYRHKIEIK